MNCFRLLLLIMTILLANPLHADESGSIAQARAAAREWLNIIDSGRYAQSWQEAAPLLRNAIGQQEWEAQLAAIRASLGDVEDRTLRSATATRTLPGVPEGNYVVIRYATRFEHRKEAIETVTPHQEDDGTWKVAGYFIRKAASHPTK